MIADDRESQIADRRSQKVLRSSAIIWKPTSAIVCDRLRSYMETSLNVSGRSSLHIRKLIGDT